jgi:hypothetical protein
MPVSTAKIVLANKTLRWSSPNLFNDPFDVPCELAFGLNPSDLVKAGAKRLVDFVNFPPQDTTNLPIKLKMIVDVAKRGMPNDVKAEILEAMEEMSTSYRPSGHSLDELRAVWRTLIPDFRILCLTESQEHIAMWYHYADKYQGAVLEFRCVDELDSAWLCARPVTYLPEKPDVYTAAGWAKLLTMQVESSVSEMMDIAAYSKAPDWSYEKEWRICSFKRATDIGNYTDYSFNAQELAAVYIGPLASEPDQTELIRLAKYYPDVSVYKVSVGMDRELHFYSVLG